MNKKQIISAFPRYSPYYRLAGCLRSCWRRLERHSPRESQETRPEDRPANQYFTALFLYFDNSNYQRFSFKSKVDRFILYYNLKLLIYRFGKNLPDDDTNVVNGDKKFKIFRIIVIYNLICFEYCNLRYS